MKSLLIQKYRDNSQLLTNKTKKKKNWIFFLFPFFLLKNILLNLIKKKLKIKN